MQRKWSPETRLELLRYVEEAERYLDVRTYRVAEEFGVSMSTARRWLYKLVGEGVMLFSYEDGMPDYAPFCAIQWSVRCDDEGRAIWRQDATTTPSTA